jgi:mannose-6-phosphate isomerase
MADVTIKHDDRPWGCYDILDAGEGYQVKRITVGPGQRLSYQRHAYRTEHWYIVSGHGIVTLDDQDTPVHPGDTVDIAIGAAHRAANPGSHDLVFVEIQTGSYFGEDDIQRLHDDYDRAEPAQRRTSH